MNVNTLYKDVKFLILLVRVVKPNSNLTQCFSYMSGFLFIIVDTVLIIEKKNTPAINDKHKITNKQKITKRNGNGFFPRRFNYHWANSHQLNTKHLLVKENEICSNKWTHPFPRQYHSQVLTIH